MNKKLVILGAGESGTGAAALAKKKGYRVFVSDSGKVKEEYKNVLCKYEIAWEEGRHTEGEVLSADEVVISPGISDDSPLVLRIKEKGINVISEIEFAGRYSKAKMIGITGSNGKTTTTHLTYHILNKAGYDAGIAGNVGKSLALQVALKDRKYFVVELSSFQLDGMGMKQLDIGILLNITPDHLNRYQGNFQNYVNSKMKILQLIKPGGTFIYCKDDQVILNEIIKSKTNVQMVPFSIKEKLEDGACIINDQLLIQINKNQFTMLLQELALQGKHNIYNSMAAGIASKIMDIRNEIIRQSFSDFQNIEHRLEHVVNVHGIEFINDSKATNVNSTWYALESMEKPLIWIVGGQDKGNDYSALKEMVAKKVKAIICIGADPASNQKIYNAFSENKKEIMDAGSIEEAVKTAYRLGKKGDAVLLSPCCASFDRFKNYEERGWRFKKAAREL